VGHDSSYNPRARRHQFSFWDLGQCITLESEEPFRKGDAVELVAVDPIPYVATVRPTALVPEDALLFLAPKVPLDEGDTFEPRATGCEVLLTRTVRLNGNMTIMALVGAPMAGRSSVTFVERASKNRFHYFISGD
jgi:hypothetical protein